MKPLGHIAARVLSPSYRFPAVGFVTFDFLFPFKATHSVPAVACKALLAVLIVDAPWPAQAAVHDTPSKVVVAWTDVTTNQGHVRAFSAAAPWVFDTPAIPVGADSTLRLADDRLYAVSTSDATITVIDTDAWAVLHTHEVCKGNDPVDIAVITADLAYVSCINETHLLRIDPLTGETTRAVDLSVFADADGIPDMNMLAVHENHLFVQLRRIDSSAFHVVPPAMIAVINLDSEQLVDADPGTPGIQAIELQGMTPRFKMQIVEVTRRLFVSASGAFFDDGGIEMIDLDTLQSLGLVVQEIDGMTGADLGAFVLVSPERGYLTFSTDFALSSHMVEFSVSEGVVPSGALFETLGYFVPTLPVDARSGTLFFPDGASSTPAVHVLDAGDASHIATVPIDLNTFPTDVVVVPATTIGPAIPASSTWSVVILLLLIAIASSALLPHRRNNSAPPKT
jgi:hypothetical protein